MGTRAVCHNLWWRRQALDTAEMSHITFRRLRGGTGERDDASNLTNIQSRVTLHSQRN